MRVIGKTMKKEVRRYATKSKCVKGIKGRMSFLSRRAFVNIVKETGCSSSSTH